MTAESGWYPDPTGTAQLRFWDGQTWTTATASPPTPPAVIQSGFAPSGYDQPAAPYGAASVLPDDGYFGGTQGPATYLGTGAQQRPAKRSKSFYGLVAGIAAAAVAVAVVIPFTVGGSSSQSAKPGSIHLPSTFNGWPRVTGSTMDSISRSLKQNWPLDTPVILGAYGEDLDNPNAIALVGTANMSQAGLAAEQRSMEHGLSSSTTTVVFTTQDPGPYGGFLRCGTLPRPGRTSVSVCFFGDLHAVGVVATMGAGDLGTQKAILLRYAVETPPAS